MSDENKASEQAVDASQVAAGPGDATSRSVNGVPAPIASPPPSDKSNPNAPETKENGKVLSTKSDSEAETDIIGEGSPEKTRTIKTEPDHPDNGSPVPSARDSKSPSDEVNSRKRKRPEDDGRGRSQQTRHPSNPRSTSLSSQAPNVRSDKGDDSESASTRRPSPHIIPASKSNTNATVRKRRLSEYNADEDEKRRKGHRQQSREGSNTKDRRETRSATYTRQPSNERSPSPVSRSHKRAPSNHSAQNAAAKKKRIPPPLVTSQKRGRSEDRGSISSSASGSPHRSTSLRKIASDSVTMSPAKMAPHRKHRDQNGRTQIARACANGDISIVRERYMERPDDLNIPDNAGNTPLQIAALEGSADIVKFLVDAGCEIDTKNIDRDTPLIDAIDNGHVDVVRILLDGGANPRLPNAQGDEPYDLVDLSQKSGHQMRKLITAAKDHDAKRRKSEDQGGHNNAPLKENSRAASAVSPRDSPPITVPRSPPASLSTSRRRTVRSEGSRNDLLWLKPTQDSLTEYAGKGDMEAVGQILNVLQKAGPESLIAAAKGGHHEVIELLFALGNANPDPNPIRGHKTGYNTPMLAAIGRGHEKVIELLVSQSNFDPTHRPYNDMTYFEIAKQRRGENWEKETKLLEEAYKSYTQKERKNRKSDPVSPRRAREKDREGRRSNHLTSSSPAATTQRSAKDDIKKARREPDVESRRSGDSAKPMKRDGPGVLKERPDKSDKSALRMVKRPKLRDSSSVDRSAVHSDQEVDSSGAGATKAKEHKTRRSQSDLPAVKHDIKPDENVSKRRLITKKARDAVQRGASNHTQPTSNDEGNSEKPSKSDANKVSSLKRPRSSETPSGSRSPSRKPSERPHSLSRRASDEIVKKRRRVEEESALTDKTKHDGDTVMTEPRDTSATSSFQKPPVSSKSSPTASAKPAKATEQVASVATAPEMSVEEKKAKEEKEKEKAEAEREAREKQLRAEAEEKAKAEAKAEQERREAEIEREKEEQRKKEEAERLARIAREEEEARREEQRKAEEEARAAQIAREEEEARLEKKRQAEKRAEEERLRRLEQERIRREEMERRQRQAFLERQAADERKRREALPNSLCKAAEFAELNPQDALEPSWIKRFFPLFTAMTKDLDPFATSNPTEQWVVNFQVAPLLGVKDLQLSQFSHWEKRIANADHRKSLWRVSRRMLAETFTLTPKNSTTEMALQMDQETHAKFKAMEHIFWVRLFDFQEIIPRYPHLQIHQPLITQKISLKSRESTSSRNSSVSYGGGQVGLNGVGSTQHSPRTGPAVLPNGVQGPNGLSEH